MKAQILAKLDSLSLVLGLALSDVNDLTALAEQLPDEAPEPVPEPEPEPTPEPVPIADIILSGDKGYNQTRLENLSAGTVIDATAATWNFDNNPATSNEQRVPIQIEKSPGFKLRGGKVEGFVKLDGEFNATYVDGSAIRILECPGAIVEDFRADRTWDGIRIRIASENFIFRRIHLSNCRDSAIENDYGHSGVVEDCLFDGALDLMGLDPPSSAPSGLDASNNKIIFKNVLGRCQLYNQSGEQTHGAPFKCNTEGTTDRNPTTEHYDCVYAIMDPNHNGQSRHKAWAAKAKGFGNCLYLNLSDRKLPATYPIPPGFTKLEGQAARDAWASLKADWLAEHPGLV
jgi:hypothetical protein